MGKERCSIDGSKTFVLKFDMHCKCNGCIKKINDGVKEISLSEGVESSDLLIGTGEVKVTGRMDPEKVRSLFQAVTKKCVRIATQGTLSEGNKNAPWFAVEAGEPSSGWRDEGSRWSFRAVVSPSAPPLPSEEEEEEAWSETTVPSGRCSYRWSAPWSSSVVWDASDITGTLAMYEL